MGCSLHSERERGDRTISIALKKPVKSILRSHASSPHRTTPEDMFIKETISRKRKGEALERGT
jgi:hypothetical protein